MIFYRAAGKDGSFIFHSLSPQRGETYYANVSSLCQDPGDGVELIILIFPSLGRRGKERKKWGRKRGNEDRVKERRVLNISLFLVKYWGSKSSVLVLLSNNRGIRGWLFPLKIREQGRYGDWNCRKIIKWFVCYMSQTFFFYLSLLYLIHPEFSLSLNSKVKIEIENSYICVSQLAKLVGSKGKIVSLFLAFA